MNLNASIHPKDVNLKAKNMKKELGIRRNVKASLKDIETLIYNQMIGDYTEVHQTNLYKKHSCEYCAYLELI